MKMWEQQLGFAITRSIRPQRFRCLATLLGEASSKPVFPAKWLSDERKRLPDEGNRSCRRAGVALAPIDSRHQQAPVAGVRPSDDLLPDPDTGGCGHPGDPDRDRGAKCGRFPAAALEWKRFRVEAFEL